MPETRLIFAILGPIATPGRLSGWKFDREEANRQA